MQSVLRHASSVSLPSHDAEHEEELDVNELGVEAINGIDPASNAEENPQETDETQFIDLHSHAAHLSDESELLKQHESALGEDIIRQVQLVNPQGLEDVLSKHRNLKIVLAEAVEFEDEDDTDTENDDLNHRVARNLAKSFADQMTQHITDHIPAHMDHMRQLPLSESLDLHTADLSEAIGIPTDILHDTDNDSDEQGLIGSIHPSQLVSHPSQLSAPHNGSMQQLLQDQFPRLPPISLPLPSTTNNMISMPQLYPSNPLVVNTSAIPDTSQSNVDLSVQVSSNNSNMARAGGRSGTEEISPKNKKKRWRPSSEQKDLLEKFWLQNQYPDQDDKMQIAQKLGEDVTYKQVTSWFKHKRENDKAKGKFTYKFSPAEKFKKEQIDLLEEVFTREPYAKGRTLQEVAQQLGVPEKRVQNWFKHRRSRLAQQGKFEYKPRQTLNPEQITFLKGAFCTNASPTPDVFEQLGTELNIRPDQVAKWFSLERHRKRRRDDELKNGLEADSDESSSDDARDIAPTTKQAKKKQKQRHPNSSNKNESPSQPTMSLNFVPLQLQMLPTISAVEIDYGSDR